MLPFTVFDSAAAYRDFVLALPEFYLAGSGGFLGAALAVLTLRHPPTPKGREKLRTRKGWAVPLLLTFSLGFLLWGFYRLGIPEFTPEQLWGFPVLALGFFLALRFPLQLGIPLGALLGIFVLLCTWFLNGWDPQRPRQTLAYARSMPEGHWELVKARGASLVPEELFPRSLWILETPGYASLTGARRWISWQDPLTGGLGELVHGLAQGWGWEFQVPLDLPPAPRTFFPSTLSVSPERIPRWDPGI